jgi:hypothetical protein
MASSAFDNATCVQLPYNPPDCNQKVAANTAPDFVLSAFITAVENTLASTAVLRRYGMPCKTKKHHKQSTAIS